MSIKQDQVLLDLNDRITKLLVSNLHHKEVIAQKDVELHELKMACDVVVIHIGLVEHKYMQFRTALTKLKHLISR